MTTITKEHFMKCVACLCGPNVATNLLQTGFAPFTFSPNNDITQSRLTIIFMIKQCSTHILPAEQEFAQVLISIV